MLKRFFICARIRIDGHEEDVRFGIGASSSAIICARITIDGHEKEVRFRVGANPSIVHRFIGLEDAAPCIFCAHVVNTINITAQEYLFINKSFQAVFAFLSAENVH
jgi:hypothetical protein